MSRPLPPDRKRTRDYDLVALLGFGVPSVYFISVNHLWTGVALFACLTAYNVWILVRNR